MNQDEVLSRDELTRHEIEDGGKYRWTWVKMEGSIDEHQYWQGDKCYIPVRFKGRPRKFRIFPKNPRTLNE